MSIHASIPTIQQIPRLKLEGQFTRKSLQEYCRAVARAGLSIEVIGVKCL
jgi:hypothetical protein